MPMASKQRGTERNDVADYLSIGVSIIVVVLGYLLQEQKSALADTRRTLEEKLAKLEEISRRDDESLREDIASLRQWLKESDKDRVFTDRDIYKEKAILEVAVAKLEVRSEHTSD